MRFPSFLDVLLHTSTVKEFSEAKNNSNEYSRHLQLMELLSKALRFSYHVHLYHDKQHGLVFGETLINEEYHQLAFYPNKVSDFTFATAKPDYTANNLAFLNTFEIDVWLFLLLSVVLLTFALFLIFRGRLFLLSVLFYTLMTFLGKHRDWKPKSEAQSLIVLTLSVGMTFLTMGYVSVLLSFITVPSQEKGIQNFDELYEAIANGRATALQFEGYTTFNEFILSGDEKLKFIGEHMEYTQRVKIGYDANFLEVMKPNIAVVGPRDLLEVSYGEGTHFISEDSTFLSLFVMYDETEDGFCCMEQVNTVIHWIWAAGLNKKIFDDYKFKEMLRYSFKFKNLYVYEKDPIQPLSLSSLSGPFYFLIVGHILAIISFLCEKIMHRYQKKV